ncbi:hypothetical protein [uncultured Paracoccus sp.]|uniref:hypothetical protein n=1 Tax=uncultured Paracoccus sp. TaxID=189685 RepID=UPI0025FB0BC8|nr:hypothetical protein [uncultured Paracoccus sp.]
MRRKITLIAGAAAAAIVVALASTPTPQDQANPQVASMTAEALANDAVTGETATLQPGQVLSPEAIRFIDFPGRYGLGTDLPGSRYAIVDGHLVRIDPDTMELQSILRKDTVAFD